MRSNTLARTHTRTGAHTHRCAHTRTRPHTRAHTPAAATGNSCLCSPPLLSPASLCLWSALELERRFLPASPPPGKASPARQGLLCQGGFGPDVLCAAGNTCSPSSAGDWQKRERLGRVLKDTPRSPGRRGCEEQGRLALLWSCQLPGVWDRSPLPPPGARNQYKKESGSKHSVLRAARASPEPGPHRRAGLLVPNCWGAPGTLEGRPIRAGGPSRATGHPHCRPGSGRTWRPPRRPQWLLDAGRECRPWRLILFWC